jgi:hypothetical protein
MTDECMTVGVEIMTEPIPNTIESNLQSGRFGEASFSKAQRTLIRAFFQHPASAWAKKVSLRKGNVTRRKRPRQTPVLLDSRTKPLASSALISRARTSPPTTIPRCTTISPSPSTSVSPAPEISRHTSIAVPSLPVAAAATAASGSHRPRRSERPALNPPPQELEKSTTHIKEEELVRSYSPVDDIENFVEGLKNFKTKSNDIAFPQDTGHFMTMFSLYVTAKTQEIMSKAVAKISATVVVSLYPDTQLAPQVMESCKTNLGKSKSQISSLVRDCKKLGRACQHVCKILGPGAILLLDGFSAWWVFRPGLQSGI